MSLEKFESSKKKASVKDLDTILYKIYNDGSFDTTTLPQGKAGLNRIPYMDADVALVSLEIPQIRGYKLKEVEISKEDGVVSLIYLST